MFSGISQFRVVESGRRATPWTSLIALLVASCGGASGASGTARPDVGPGPAHEPSDGEAAREADGERPGARAGERADSVAAEPPTAASPAALGMAGPALIPSGMEGRLAELGLDPKALPEMSALTPKQRFKVMDLIAESLGASCGSCHEGKNYKRETDHKKVARFMWNTLTAPHTLAEGPLFCDSCHQGNRNHLDRNHPTGVKPYMEAEYSGRLLRRSDNEAVPCSTCHGQEFEPDILDKLP